MARGCGAKHICASKCRKHLSAGDILEVPMFQNATRLWRKAHLQVKMHKHHIPGAILEVPMFKNCHAAVARSTFACENVKKLTGSDHFLKV